MPPFIKHVTRHRNKTVMKVKSDFCFKYTSVGKISKTKDAYNINNQFNYDTQTIGLAFVDKHTLC